MEVLQMTLAIVFISQSIVISSAAYNGKAKASLRAFMTIAYLITGVLCLRAAMG